MKNVSLILIALAAAVLAAGCSQQAPAPQAEQAPAAPEAEAPAPTALEVVSVSADGTEFDPPVEVEQIPAGAWYCDMGTVHYAQMNESDAKCQVCGMNLTHKMAEADMHGGEMHDESMHDGGMHEGGGEHQG